MHDDGEGIEPQAMPRIFEPFYTADDAQGSGLGLALASELAERMEGRLSVASTRATRCSRSSCRAELGQLQWLTVAVDHHTELVLALARRLREVVVPELGSHAGRAQLGDGTGGDVTFAVDEVAETSLEAFVSEHASRMAFYSEDRGLIAADDATHVLVVDPIDGTRPAMAGLESACVAVALAPLDDGEPTMGDLEIGCVIEIKTGDWYLAVRDGGVQSSRPVALSRDADLSRMFWGYGFRGRPARPTVEVLAELIDASSVGGGTFELGSQSFVMTRVVTGQLDAVIEVGSRMIDEVPGMRAEFEVVGGGRILNNSPYDLAAAWLCLTEAGGVVTDGWGEPLDRHRLLGSGHEFQMSSISAANRELHTQLVSAVDRGVARLRELRS